jgi:hypothetical protein
MCSPQCPHPFLLGKMAAHNEIFNFGDARQNYCICDGQIFDGTTITFRQRGEPNDRRATQNICQDMEPRDSPMACVFAPLLRHGQSGAPSHK